MILKPIYFKELIKLFAEAI